MPALVQEEKGLQEERTTHVDEGVHRKRMIQAYQEEIQTLKEMKEEEKKELTSGRRRWFNKQIEDLREKIKEIKGDSSE